MPWSLLGQISHMFVSVVSRFMANPIYEHWSAVQWIMRYLKGTMEFGLVHGGLNKKGHKLVGYVDSYFARGLDKGDLRHVFYSLWEAVQ